ncbi:MAG: Lrp/AsnC family transcriptional regulator [Inquilinus sp.]|nr:Lrp/AsnC family transcriptional regulator [Inquilinus sp.]
MDCGSTYDTLDRRLLDEFQRGFPLTERPFADLAERLQTGEGEVIERLRRLKEEGAVSRVGAVVAPHALGRSTLAALAVPAERLDEIAELVSGYHEVNHNYEREHRFNLWFVVTAEDEDAVAAVLDDIARRTGLEPLDLPLLEPFHLDLGFALQWR